MTLDQIRNALQSSKALPLLEFKPGLKVTPLNKMDKGDYTYTLKAPYGDVYADDFQPYFTPEEMLTLGVFEGKYINDCVSEFPKEWFEKALKANSLSPEHPNILCNYFKIKSRMSLQDWINNGWIPITKGDPDNRGWFQWYCRYYIGRRIPHVDEIQKKRWRAFKRHFAQVQKNCISGDKTCRPKQRQALLQWGYNSLI